MITLTHKEIGTTLGTIHEGELEFLMDLREEKEVPPSLPSIDPPVSCDERSLHRPDWLLRTPSPWSR